VNVQTGETGIRVFKDEETGQPVWSLQTRSKTLAGTICDTDIVSFLVDLQEIIADYLHGNYMAIYTQHRRNGQTFRAHPNKKYWGKGPW
jgi:hypothetical protein